VVEPIKPNIEWEQLSDAYGRVRIEPLEPGFGTTLGNSLRRVLLSSLPGAAVTAVRIEGVQHEFSTLPHIKEDVTELLLNIKGIRIRPLSQRPGTLILEASGEGPVCAGDVMPSPDFAIANPELHLALLDSADAKLKAEFYVEHGKGYQEAKSGDDLPIGVLPLDAIFTPIRRINFTVGKTRVGHISNYDSLTIEVWTDGTISPAEAIAQSARILVQHLSPFCELSKPAPIEPSVELYDMPIEQLGLSQRTLNALKRNKISKVKELLEQGKEGLRGMRGFGEKSSAEVWGQLEALGLVPKEEVPPEAETEEEIALRALQEKGFKVKRVR
jgi:DNA-directed RNA polymerase subunit alpha